jgi:hypothetical protein
VPRSRVKQHICPFRVYSGWPSKQAKATASHKRHMEPIPLHFFCATIGSLKTLPWHLLANAPFSPHVVILVLGTPTMHINQAGDCRPLATTSEPVFCAMTLRYCKLVLPLAWTGSIFWAHDGRYGAFAA